MIFLNLQDEIIINELNKYIELDKIDLNQQNILDFILSNTKTSLASIFMKLLKIKVINVDDYDDTISRLIKTQKQSLFNNYKINDIIELLKPKSLIVFNSILDLPKLKRSLSTDSKLSIESVSPRLRYSPINFKYSPKINNKKLIINSRIEKF